ncbi:MAG: hypothetical protein IKY52_04550 [Clostridia bacterium]|nr:hypothetical protein [Clostridia bacterium]
MAETNGFVTIEKVDKGTETAAALLEFVENFSWEQDIYTLGARRFIREVRLQLCKGYCELRREYRPPVC